MPRSLRISTPIGCVRSRLPTPAKRFTSSSSDTSTRAPAIPRQVEKPDVRFRRGIEHQFGKRPDGGVGTIRRTCPYVAAIREPAELPFQFGPVPDVPDLALIIERGNLLSPLHFATRGVDELPWSRLE